MILLRCTAAVVTALTTSGAALAAEEIVRSRPTGGRWWPPSFALKRRYRGPLLLIQGLQDTRLLPDHGCADQAAHGGEGTLLIEDMGRVFDVLETSATYIVVLEATVEFFNSGRLEAWLD